MTATFVPAPPVQVPMVDVKTGLITRPWYAYHLARHEQAGSSSDKIDAAYTAAIAAAPATTEVVAIGGLHLGGAIGGNVAISLYRASDLLASLPTAGNIDGDWSYAVDSGKPVWWAGGAWNAVGSGGGGGGTVTSVGLAVPAIFTVSGSPVVGAGTLTFTLATQAANLVWAGPTTGAAAAPTFRALVAADIPTIAIVAGTTGTLTVARGGTGVATLGANGVVIGQGASNVTVAAAGSAGQVLTSNGAGVDPTMQALPALVSSVNNQWFGDGSDGDLTISSGVTSAPRDMYYNNVTITGTASLDPHGYRIFIFGTLDLTNAPANAIRQLGAGPIDGGTPTQGQGAVLGTVGGGLSGTSGAGGGTGAGAQSGPTSAAANVFQAGVTGASGAGGTSGANAGGASRAGITGANPVDTRYATQTMSQWSNGTWSVIKGGSGACGGGSGGGDGTGTGGSGGGGGGGAGVLWLAANIISRGASTAANAISVAGGNGGSGGAASGGTNPAGGGGGAGAVAGLLALFYGSLSGTSATNMINLSGGSGGPGGNGRGTGGGGNGGGAGAQGGANIFNMTSGASTIYRGSTAAIAGNAASGSTGGAALTNTYQISL